MATYTPPKGVWIDVGHRIQEFESQHDAISNAESLRPRASHEKRQFSTPPKSLSRESAGLITPPPSGEKKGPAASSQRSKISHHGYDYRLREPDSKGRQLHRLVFRWWSEESKGLNSATQLRAGLYKNVKTTVPPPFCGPALIDAFLSHLTPKPNASPFISVFESFLPALQRALKSKKDAYISIIDLHQVEKESRQRFPSAIEVVWTVKGIVKQYNFDLRNGYRGNEWLVHGVIEMAAIVQTVKVSDLRDFARTGRVRHMRDILNFISHEQYAFGLVDNLPIKFPKTNYRTGQLVGRVLEHINIPDRYKAVLARKVKNVMHFEHSLSLPRQRAYLKGVYNFDHPDSDSDSDGLDDFLVDSDGEYNSDDTFWDDSEPDNLSRIKKRKADRDAGSATDDSEIDGNTDSGESTDTKLKTRARGGRMVTDESDAADGEDEQALLDAQLHATEEEWIKTAPAPVYKMVRMSHVEVPKLTAEQRASFKPLKPVASGMIDLTADADDDVIEVQPRTNKEDATEVERAARANKTMTLPLRSTSIRSTVGPGGGLTRLEDDARMEVVEVMQFD